MQLMIDALKPGGGLAGDRTGAARGPVRQRPAPPVRPGLPHAARLRDVPSPRLARAA